MISEFPNLPRQLSPEDRFIIALKSELKKHAQEINNLSKNVSGIDLSNLDIDLSDYFTKEEVEQLLSNLQTEVGNALENCVTETDLQEAISNIDIHTDDVPWWLDKFIVQNGKLCQVVSE